jgi:TRAP-type C4-dicarboxylate transport system permease small subunit
MLPEKNKKGIRSWMNCCLVLSLFLLWGGFSSSAQDYHIEFDHYTTRDGLSNGYVSSILPRFQGFYVDWNMNGLNRFDGINFRNIISIPMK